MVFMFDLDEARTVDTLPSARGLDPRLALEEVGIEDRDSEAPKRLASVEREEAKRDRARW